MSSEVNLYQRAITMNCRAKNERIHGEITGEQLELLLNLCDKCENCGSTKKLCIDHVVPVCDGGVNAISNFQVLCRMCNSVKRSSSVDYRNKECMEKMSTIPGWEESLQLEADVRVAKLIAFEVMNTGILRNLMRELDERLSSIELSIEELKQGGSAPATENAAIHRPADVQPLPDRRVHDVNVNWQKKVDKRIRSRLKKKEESGLAL